MELRGEIKTVIFNNPETGYSVLDVIIGGGEVITAVGIFPPITEGENVVMRGAFKFHSRHGTQFLAEEVETFPPDKAGSIIKYLGSGLFKGIGEATARAIVSAYGNQTLEVIENSPTALYKIKGISLKRAMEIGLQYNQMKRMKDAVMFLQKHGISVNLAIKIYKFYGDDTVKIVEGNPYRLVEDVDGVGFTTADRIAQSMGIDKSSDFRIRAGITFVIKNAATKNGHTYLPEDVLFRELFALLELDEEYFERVADNLSDMSFRRDVKIIYKNGKKCIILDKFFITEFSIADKLKQIQAERLPGSINPTDGIAAYEKINKIELHEVQRQAVINALEQGVEVITGGPGTGKTTIVKCILYILEAEGKKVSLCAPTGRAAKRLSEATGAQAKTIHRLLDLDFTDGKGHFTYNENTRLNSDVVIVDEVSMVDEYVFNALVRAVKKGASLILVGDKDQLPSVGAGNVLADVIACGKFPVTCLTHIYRQAEQSLIVLNAHRINKGIMPIVDRVDKDFFFEEHNTPIAAKNAVVNMVTKRLPSYLNVKAEDIQVLCPMKKGVAGVENLNREIREKLNPLNGRKMEIKQGENTFRVGDKVMQIVNNYQQPWTVSLPTHTESGMGVYNGDLGFIEEINMLNQTFKIRFTDDKVAVYGFSNIDQIVLAYAVSIHKSQGSEFDVVVISVVGNNNLLMTRNLLYTAVTRAKKMVIVVGEYDALQKMVKNNYTAARYTNLREFITGDYKTEDESCV